MALLHVVPLVRRAAALDPKAIQRSASNEFGPPDRGTTILDHTHDFSFDGVIFSDHGRRSREPCSAYCLVFRDGTLEACTARVGRLGDGPDESGSVPQILLGRMIVAGTLRTVPRYVRGLARHGVAPPYAIMLSIMGVQGFWVWHDFHDPEGGGPCDRDELRLPAAILDTADLSDGWEAALCPALDALWQAFGMSECPGFGPDGRWRVNG
jgi:hypothetical protein